LIGQLVKIAKTRRTDVGSWALALGFFAVAIVVGLPLAGWLDPVPFITFYPAIVASTLFCGWRQGAVVTALSTMAGWFFFVEPQYPFAVNSYRDALGIVEFLVVAMFLLALVEGLVQTVLQLDATARLNEDLFRELQHRVSNNLQIVAATLEKAQRSMREPEALQIVNLAIGRIHSMAGLHRRMYDTTAYAHGVGPILRDLLGETFRGLQVDSRLEIGGGELPVGQMTAIALLVNEAAINAAKHVFRPGRGGRFEVSLAEIDPGHMQLTIRDDGPGISSEAAAQTHRFGLTVMRGLARQLGGSLEMKEGPGATICVRFPRQ